MNNKCPKHGFIKHKLICEECFKESQKIIIEQALNINNLIKEINSIVSNLKEDSSIPKSLIERIDSLKDFIIYKGETE